MIDNNYLAETCSRRQWNEEKQCWERFFNDCNICSFMCIGRAYDFEKQGKHSYIDTETGLAYWK